LSNNPPNLSKVAVAGVGLGVVGVVLFVILWVVFGQMGVASLARLVVSLCLPPLVIAGLIGVYVLLMKGRSSG
jgi:lipopolysaccharide export LptBFGC system permease protein LptF